jgi:hypothetical protein
MSNGEVREGKDTGDRPMVSIEEVSKLLQIYAATAELWGDIGLLKDGFSPGRRKRSVMTGISTLPPAEKNIRFFMGSADTSTKRDREQLARMNVQEITELTRHSVSIIEHLGIGTV